MSLKRTVAVKVASHIKVDVPRDQAYWRNTAVQRAIQYMADHMGDEVTVDHVAQSMQYSKYHASRLFTRVVGVTPGRYLSEMRLRHAAKILMEHPKVLITDVVSLVGYNSVGTFSTRFSTFWGVPPTQYRVSRCRCGAFDSYDVIAERDHSTSRYCRAKLDDSGKKILCVRCHSCLSKRVAAAAQDDAGEGEVVILVNKLLQMEEGIRDGRGMRR